MNKETYERLDMNVTEFDAEDVIRTSLVLDDWEQTGPTFPVGG